MYTYRHRHLTNRLTWPATGARGTTPLVQIPALDPYTRRKYISGADLYACAEHTHTHATQAENTASEKSAPDKEDKTKLNENNHILQLESCNDQNL